MTSSTRDQPGDTEWSFDSQPVKYAMGERYGRPVSLLILSLSGLLALAGMVAVLVGLGLWEALTVGGLDGGGREAICAIGLILSSIGLWSFGKNLAHWTRHRRLPKSGAPSWKADYPWDPSGCDDQNRKSFADHLGCGFFALLFACVAGLLVRRSAGGGTVLTGLVWLFGLLGLLQLLWGSIVWRRNLRFGTSRLRYARCPFALGSELQAIWLGGELLREASSLQVTIRCLEEQVTAGYDQAEEGTVRMQLCMLSRVFEIDPDSYSSGKFSIRAPLPKDPALRTFLSARQARKMPRYWMLTIEAADRKAALKAEFLVPVY